jgi:hypothetical protein
MRRSIVSVALFVAVFRAAPAARADVEYTLADDHADLVLSIDPHEAVVHLNTFPVDPAGRYIDLIRVAYGRVGGPTPINNQPVRILLYEDPNGGSPQDATLLWSLDTVVANGNTDVLNEYAVPGILVHGTLVVGFYYNNVNPIPVYIGPLDTTAPTYAQRSFFGYAAALDPANLGAIPAGQFMAQEDSGTAGNYRIEARGTSTDGIVVLVSTDVPGGVVRLSWTGSKSAYDVERASQADFGDGVVIAAGVPGPTYDDPVLGDATTWYYRVR